MQVSCRSGLELARVSRPLRSQHRSISQILSAPLSSTPRTRITRHRERGGEELADLFAIIREALLCHAGVARDGAPVVLPSIHAAPPDGPDEGGTLYLH